MKFAEFLTFFMEEIKCDSFFFFLPAGNLQVKTPQTEVESVTVHRGWSSAMLLSGGKTASPSKLHEENWFSATTTLGKEDVHRCIMPK